MCANGQNQHGPGVLSKEEMDAQERAFQERVEADIKIGAKVDADTWRNSGGRVLGITARGGTVATARAAAYAAVATVEFEHAQWRQDIGLRAT